MSEKAKIQAMRRLAALVRSEVDAHFSLRLWDGSVEPLGADPQVGLLLTLKSAGVVPSLLHRPTLDRLNRLYARGGIDVAGGSLIDLAEPIAHDRA